MPTRLLPDFRAALHKLTDDLSAISANSTMVRHELGKVRDQLVQLRGADAPHVAVVQQLASLNDICEASDDSIERVAAIRLVYNSLQASDQAEDDLAKLARPQNEQFRKPKS